MPLTTEDVKAHVVTFCTHYPVAAQIQYRVRNHPEELYGKAFESYQSKQYTIFGGYYPATQATRFERTPRGHFFRGRCDLFAAAFPNESTCKHTIRHEILGHFGLNCFEPQEKRSILAAIIDAKYTPIIFDYWLKVERNSPDYPLPRKAEEVYAFAAEKIEPERAVNKAEGEKSLQECCTKSIRLLTLRDLQNITEMVADGFRNRTRDQKTFPTLADMQFKT